MTYCFFWQHEWEDFGDADLLRGNGTIIGKCYVQQCKRCKKIRKQIIDSRIEW